MSHASLRQPSQYDLTASLQADPEHQCPVCGHHGVKQFDVLWPELIEAWDLTPPETALINRQQGELCQHCECNLRSRTLAGALCQSLHWKGSLKLLTDAAILESSHLLEINEAGQLHTFLQRWPYYTFAAYPQIDMQAMPYDDQQFDLIIHSDTLEHVPDPIKALAECHRLLKPMGSMIMTIPIVPTRLTRRRDHLPESYHGQSGTAAGDMKVITEYGADFYLDLIQAGWRQVTLYTLGSLASLAVIGTK